MHERELHVTVEPLIVANASATSRRLNSNFTVPWHGPQLGNETTYGAPDVVSECRDRDLQAIATIETGPPNIPSPSLTT